METQLDEATKERLMAIGFAEKELEFFTPKQAQETIRRFNEKLRRTKSWQACSVKVQS